MALTAYNVCIALSVNHRRQGAKNKGYIFLQFALMFTVKVIERAHEGMKGYVACLNYLSH